MAANRHRFPPFMWASRLDLPRSLSRSLLQFREPRISRRDTAARWRGSIRWQTPPGPALGLLLKSFEPPCFAAAPALFGAGSPGLVGFGRAGGGLAGLPAGGEPL